MKKKGCSEDEIRAYKKKNRRFYVIRESEIADAMAAGDYETAINVLLESKALDLGNQEQIKKYSEKLIDIYKETGDIEEFCKESIYFLETFWQFDLKYVTALKSCIPGKERWEHIVDGIIAKNKHVEFVCRLLNKEKRYEQLMTKIENNFDGVRLLDEYEKVLCKQMPDRVIKVYSDYLVKAADVANDRNKYKSLMVYLKKISACAGGKEIAKEIKPETQVLTGICFGILV